MGDGEGKKGGEEGERKGERMGGVNIENSLHVA